MKKHSSEFSQLADHYDAARPDYPKRIIDTLRETIGKDHPLILDMGCGTGISTRQLAKSGALVIGCDIDVNMLAKAVAHTEKGTAYVQGQADAIPFASQTFDAVTTFSALHWFCDDDSLQDIQRVLKPKGVLCIVQRRYVSPHAKDLWDILEQTFNLKPKRLYSTDKFEDRLLANSFKVAQLPIVKTTVKYTLERFLMLLQSYSIWNNVPMNKRSIILKYLRQHFQSHLKAGFIHDTHETTIIIAKKK